MLDSGPLADLTMSDGFKALEWDCESHAVTNIGQKSCHASDTTGPCQSAFVTVVRLLFGRSVVRASHRCCDAFLQHNMDATNAAV